MWSLQFCHGDIGCTHFDPENRHSCREAQVSCKVESCIWFFAQECGNGACRYYYAHKNNNLMERSKLVAIKGDLVGIKNVLSNTILIEACTKERAKTKSIFHKLTKVNVFAALLSKDPMVYKHAVLPEPLTKNHTVNCLTNDENTRKPYNDNLCLF